MEKLADISSFESLESSRGGSSVFNADYYRNKFGDKSLPYHGSIIQALKQNRDGSVPGFNTNFKILPAMKKLFSDVASASKDAQNKIDEMMRRTDPWDTAWYQLRHYIDRCSQYLGWCRAMLDKPLVLKRN